MLKISPGDVDAARALAPLQASAPAPPQSQRHAVVPAKAQNPEVIERARAGAPLDKAEKLIMAGKLEEAEQILETLLEHSNELIIPRQRLAEINTRQKRYAKAAAEYVILADERPEDSTFLLRAAQNFSWQKDYESAARYYRRYLTRKPADHPIQLELAAVLLWGDQAADAAAVYRAYLEYDPENVEARLKLADALLWSKQFGPANQAFRQVLEARPADPEAEYGLGQCYEQEGQLDLAMKAYQKASETDPKDEKLAAARARVAEALPQHHAFQKLENREYGSAADSFLEYLNQHPDSTETMLELARVYSWGKLYAKAVDYYRQYLQHVPNDETSLRELAKVEMTMPDFAHAQTDYATLVHGGHASIEDYESLVNAYVWSDKLPEAQPYAEKLASLSPGNSAALEARKLYRDRQRLNTFETAQKLAKDGRLQEALTLYLDYARRFGSDRETDLSICRMYNWSKQYATAERGYLEFSLATATIRKRDWSWRRCRHGRANTLRRKAPIRMCWRTTRRIRRHFWAWLRLRTSAALIASMLSRRIAGRWRKIRPTPRRRRGSKKSGRRSTRRSLSRRAASQIPTTSPAR